MMLKGLHMRCSHNGEGAIIRSQFALHLARAYLLPHKFLYIHFLQLLHQLLRPTAGAAAAFPTHIPLLEVSS